MAAGARQTVENLRLQLDEVVKERDLNRAAAQDLAALKAGQEEREKSFQQQIEALKDAKESLSAQFHEIGSKLLGDARKTFLEQAGEKFTQAVSARRVASEDPIRRSCRRSRKSASTIMPDCAKPSSWSARGRGRFATRPAAWSMLCALAQDARPLGRAVLKNVLEQAGLSPYADFQTGSVGPG